jgi:putative addiction module killer protein
MRRLERLQNNQFGDIKLIGAGVFELREHFGPGWRMYYIQRGSEIIVMLGGGDKSSQAADITKAQRLAKTLED